MKRTTRFGLIRDVILLANGIALLWYEAIFEQVDRPWLLIVAVALCGVPVFLPSGVGELLEKGAPRK